MHAENKLYKWISLALLTLTDLDLFVVDKRFGQKFARFHRLRIIPLAHEAQYFRCHALQSLDSLNSSSKPKSKPDRGAILRR